MGLAAWAAYPDDDTAHRTILSWLQQAVNGNFIQNGSPLSTRIKGNLGEFIVYQIGKSYAFTNLTIADAANAWIPLSDISRPDIDIVWLHFGTSAADDWAALQEVKTTGQSRLALADDLTADYDKLFGENPRLTLRTRLDALKNKLEQQRREHLSPRLTALGGPSPKQAHGIRLLPTLVHDSALDSSTKMVAVRQVLIGRGWSSGVVECWSVALQDLDRRLVRLALGQP